MAEAAGRLVRKTAVELAADAIRDRILSGELPPGAALRQEALAEKLGVSRIPLREAIRQLSNEGLVDLQPHRGAFVSTLSKAEVQEFFDLRFKLEPWLLREAVPHMQPAELDRAEAIVASMDRAQAAQWGVLNWSLHEMLYTAARRPATLAIVRSLHERCERYLRFQVMNAPVRRQAHAEHMEIIGLCRRGNARKAEAALAAHIEAAAAQVQAIVGRLLDA